MCFLDKELLCLSPSTLSIAVFNSGDILLFFFSSVMCVLDTITEVRDLLMWTFRAYLCLALSHLGVSLGRIKCPFSDHFHVLCETGIQVHLSACAEQLKAVFTCMHCPCTVYLCFLKCCLR